MKYMKFCILVLLLFAMQVNLVAQERLGTYGGGKYLTHVQSARTLNRGAIVGYTRIRGFTGTFDLRNDQGSAGLSVAVFQAGLNWALTQRLEFGYGISLLQDTNIGDPNLPDRMFAGIKVGKISIANALQLGVAAGARFAVGEIGNVPFETYSGPNLEYSVLGILSYFADPLFPDDSWGVHLNIGYLSHNDGAAEIKDSSVRLPRTIEQQSSEILYGLGVEFPSESFDILFGVHGNAFISQPDSFIYARESYLYITPGFRYKPKPSIKVNLSFDLLITGNGTDQTVYQEDSFDTRNAAVPGVTEESMINYQSWRLNLGGEMQLIAPSEVRSDPTTVRERERKRRRQVLEKVILEEEETESAEDELEKLRNERKKAEVELEKIRKLLEKGGGGGR